LRLLNGDEIDGRFARFARRVPKVLADDVSRLCGGAIFWRAVCCPGHCLKRSMSQRPAGPGGLAVT
jgi:hypothetical protein